MNHSRKDLNTMSNYSFLKQIEDSYLVDETNVIVYITASYPSPAAIIRQKNVLENNLNRFKTLIISWDRKNKGETKFEENIVCIKCGKNIVGYGKSKIKKFSVFYEIKRFFWIASKIIKKVQPKSIILVDWKTLGFLDHTKEKCVYLVQDMPNSIISRIYEHHFLKKAKIAEIWLHSNYFRDFYKRYHIEKKIVRALPPQAFFSITKSSLSIYKKKQKLRIIFHGIIRYSRNIIALINAVEKFKGKVTLDIYGHGPEEENIINYLEKKSSTYTKLYGRYSYDEIPNILKNYDVVSILYPKDRNAKHALSNKLYEAILFRKPIIFTSGTATSKVNKKYKIGFGVKNPSNSSQIYEAIRKIKNEDNWDFDKAQGFIRPFEEEFREVIKELDY